MKTELTTKNLSDPFNFQWWKKEFLEKTDNLNCPSVIEDCIKQPEVLKMRKNVKNIIRELCQLRTKKYGWRVFVNGKKLEEYEMDFIYNNPPREEENIQEWTKRIFGSKKFGMIINKGEKLDLDLSANIASKLESLINTIGIPLLGIHFTIFIGNYGWTPIGIHSDIKGESVIHFHLGPGFKSMYLWDKEQYISKVDEKDRQNNKNIEELLPIAKEYTFSQGDLFFMPPNEYHIGKSDEMSVGVTTWFNNFPKIHLAKKLVTPLLDEYLEDSQDVLLPDKNDVNDLTSGQEAINLFKLPEYMLNMNFNQILNENYKDLRYSIASNGGLETSPLNEKGQDDFKKNDTIVLNKPFVLRYRDSPDGNKIFIYSRGKKIIFKNFNCIKPFIEKINEGNVLRVQELLDILDKEWDDNIGLYIISLLNNHHGIIRLHQS